MRVLIAYDGSECSDAAVTSLRKAGIPDDAEVLLIYVIDFGVSPSIGPELKPGMSHEPSKSDLREAKGITFDAYRWIESHFPDWAVSRQVLWGSPATVILEKAASWRADLIVMGSHGRSMAGRVLLGSVSMKLSHEAPCSVRVVRMGVESTGPIRIVAGIDASSDARSVVEELSKRTWPEGTEVRLVSVVESVASVVVALQPTVGSENTVSAIQDSIQRQRDLFRDIAKESRDCLELAGLLVSESQLEGNPRHEILEEAKRWNADTICVGPRGMGRLEGLLLGSVSDSVLKHAHCAVEIIRRAS